MLGVDSKGKSSEERSYVQLTHDRRFAFGENWARFLDRLSEDRIREAEWSLSEALGHDGIAGHTFLDVGSGSGLFSLAARRLGARVHSFDYDPASVKSTAEVQRQYFPRDPDWTIEHGSILDESYVRTLGQFDVVYAWGVLHHTGAMWKAMENVARLVAPRGRVFVAVYNDQGPRSRWWTEIKRWYNRLPAALQPALAAAFVPLFWGPAVLRDVLHGHPTRSWRAYVRSRGMSPWTDVVDWVGGYPFEVATPERVFDFFAGQGFVLEWLRTCGGSLGNNQFVFGRRAT